MVHAIGDKEDHLWGGGCGGDHAFVVMRADYADLRMTESPASEKVGSDVRVSCAQDLPLGAVNRALFFLHQGDDFRELALHARCDDELADIMEHRGHEAVVVE